MDHQRLPESIARHLAQVWAIHRTPAFVEYLRQTFGGEPQQPVRFAGIFCLQMIGGYFFPDLPAGPGPAIEGVWLTDDTGFRASSMEAFRLADHPIPLDGARESNNPLVAFDPAEARTEPISSQPYLFGYPKFLFSVRGDEIMYIENYGYSAWCRKVGKLVVNDRAQIQETRIQTKMWQGQLVVMEECAEP